MSFGSSWVLFEGYKEGESKMEVDEIANGGDASVIEFFNKSEESKCHIADQYLPVQVSSSQLSMDASD
eukprot:CAMPEP_0202965068 /NCGR_PEP_ID=MMETSP1396-20130829/9170_1 /ASSEMBLY_ACC=CAM_ASM_000872 /TAXON_ID= /ORGANISM="Pseudokeronopsis sp., Strain Brazil" /LENGTH=67 /DNA_ID=CAMNT_0049687667 /DNA_START=508 /DNA_END=711 /DNA_ORIENTATION=-